MALTLAFFIGVLCGLVPGILTGAIIADTLNAQRARRRRHTIDLHGADALESWLTGIDWHRPTNGTPFEEDEVA